MGRWTWWPAIGALLPLLCVQLVFLHATPSSAQLSNPVAHDDNMKERLKNNKFTQREATDDSNPLPQLDEDALSDSQCPQKLELRWQTEVGSSIYATPLITDINSDGKLEVVVPTFVHYLEILEGADGEKLTGWPVEHQSTVHASALLYDIDRDGNKEIVLATFNGEILFYRPAGYQLPEKLTVPRLKVQKDWYVGLDLDPVDRSHPDIQDESVLEQMKKSGKMESADPVKDKSSILGKEELVNPHKEDIASSVDEESIYPGREESLRPVNDESRRIIPDPDTQKPVNTIRDANVVLLGSNFESKTNDDIVSSNVASDLLTNSGDLSQEANFQRRLLQAEGSNGAEDSLTTDSKVDNGEDAKTNAADKPSTVEDPEDKMEDEAVASFDIFKDRDENNDALTDEYAYDYDDYINEDMWGDEDWEVVQREKMEKLIEVDSHILATPVIVDIDNDGIDEMVIAVSYFYDHEYYDTKDHAMELGEDLDLSKYVAGAIVVYDLDSKQLKWQLQLDLSTDSTTYRAYIYSPPTVVDLDGDGYLDIVVGTSMGYVYVINHLGQSKRGFPLLMGEIQAQVVAADINDDGEIELVTADSKGNVAAWTGNGNEIWEVHLASLISQGPTVGDVDGDGHTELVIPTNSGNIYVLRGLDGTKIGPHPFRTHGRVMSPALLVDLSKRDAERRGLTIAVGSFDGYFYLIDGPTGCAEAIDIGETSYSMALADNVDGGDDLDIVVTTMNGNVYCFQTPAPHHPLKAWPMQTQGRNVFASRYQREGIYVVPSSRMFRDEAGDNFHLTFEIVDKFVVPSGALAPYNVKVSLQTPGNYRGEKRVSYNYSYDRPGVYTLTIPCLSSRISGRVLVEMVDKNSLYFFDEFALTFHQHYYQLLKWLLTLPLLGMAGMFLVSPMQGGISLPSFTRERYQL